MNLQRSVVTLLLCLLFEGSGVPVAETAELSSAGAEAPSDAAYETVLRRLETNRSVRLTTDRSRFEAHWNEATREGISYSMHEQDRVGSGLADSSGTPLLSWTEIQRIEKRGRATRLGSRIGIVVGFVGGGIAGGIESMDCSSSFCGDDLAGDIALGALVGAVAGGLTGALIGTAFPQWHSVYEGQ